ncbi:MAG: hypothetical protein PHU34_09310 [Candidatus Methanoperedens sp.]|nr:hypothetical protein [Candidatus Methanoperedens sp.]
MRRTVSIDSKLADELRDFAEKKHGFRHGVVKKEAEEAIKKHIGGGG